MTDYSEVLYSKRLKILEQADVVVCGGGTAGAAAAIAAARTGASVIIVEREGCLGGTGVQSLVSLMAYGYHDKERFIIGGIFDEIREELSARDAIIKNSRFGWEPYNPETLKQILFEKCAEMNIKVLCRTYVCDAIISNGHIDGLVVGGKKGSFIIRGKEYVDATGDADIFHYCGAATEYGRSSDHAVQPLTMMYVLGGVDIARVGSLQERGLWQTEDGRIYVNATGFSRFLDGECKKVIPRDSISSFFSIPWASGVVGVNFGRVFISDVLSAEEVTKATIQGLTQMNYGIEYFRKNIPGFEECYLLYSAPEIGVRESRRIVGEYMLTVGDVKCQSQFDDVVAQGCYMIDIHSPSDDSTEFYKLPRGTHYDIPYRCLFSSSAKNLLAAGRCISAEHGAMAAIRVQPICMAVGQAAGIAAALSAQAGTYPADINTGVLQAHLKKQGAILE